MRMSGKGNETTRRNSKTVGHQAHRQYIAVFWNEILAERGGFEPPVHVLARTTV